MSVPAWWPFPEEPDEAQRSPTRPVPCLKCGRATWRKLDAYVGVHRQCEEVQEVARL